MEIAQLTTPGAFIGLGLPISNPFIKMFNIDITLCCFNFFFNFSQNHFSFGGGKQFFP